eukprot:CAMPEP_0175770004 /NCGR_PEP_ID=MMETSP0097-20121207/71262_1 /TAXON_ID=311494 /ORGANISM="Alexandrium monilatum, Strain CCMP3105" /LENGTH=46 /DNA_ID= /DNA_START= /DNA_END= /DNA_ORIENTATION=
MAVDKPELDRGHPALCGSALPLHPPGVNPARAPVLAARKPHLDQVP